MARMQTLNGTDFCFLKKKEGKIDEWNLLAPCSCKETTCLKQRQEISAVDAKGCGTGQCEDTLENPSFKILRWVYVHQ